MQKKGLRDLKTTKTPEASIAGAMARDVLFVRVAQSTFALQSVIVHHRKILSTSKHAERTPPPDAPAAAAGMDVDATTAAKPEATAATLPEEEAEYSISEDEEEDADGVGRQSDHQPWLTALLSHDYDSLSFTDRLAALSFLINLVVNSPTVRAKMDDREEQATKLKKALLEEVKVDGGGRSRPLSDLCTNLLLRTSARRKLPLPLLLAPSASMAPQHLGCRRVMLPWLKQLCLLLWRRRSTREKLARGKRRRTRANGTTIASKRCAR